MVPKRPGGSAAKLLLLSGNGNCPVIWVGFDPISPRFRRQPVFKIPCPQGCEGSTPSSGIHGPIVTNVPAKTYERSAAIPKNRRARRRALLTVEQLPADVRAIVQRWDELPEAVRVGIVAMVKAACPPAGGA